MAKIYISGPITGHSDYMEKFSEAEIELKMAFPNAAIINPAKTSATLPAEAMEYGDYIKVCITLLDLADAVYLLDGWEESKGSQLENAYARMQGKTVFHRKELIR